MQDSTQQPAGRLIRHMRLARAASGPSRDGAHVRRDELFDKRVPIDLIAANSAPSSRRCVSSKEAPRRSSSVSQNSGGAGDSSRVAALAETPWRANADFRGRRVKRRRILESASERPQSLEQFDPLVQAIRMKVVPTREANGAGSESGPVTGRRSVGPNLAITASKLSRSHARAGDRPNSTDDAGLSGAASARRKANFASSVGNFSRSGRAGQAASSVELGDAGPCCGPRQLGRGDRQVRADAAPSRPPARIPNRRHSLRELDDFHPDRLYQRVELFERLRSLRTPTPDTRRLTRRPRKSAVARHGVSARAATRDESPRPPRFWADADDLLGASLDETQRRDSGPNWAAIRSIGTRFVKQLVAPYVRSVPATDPKQPELVACVDEAAGGLLRAILHAPAFQALESAWRGVDLLVRPSRRIVYCRSICSMSRSRNSRPTCRRARTQPGGPV